MKNEKKKSRGQRGERCYFADREDGGKGHEPGNIGGL